MIWLKNLKIFFLKNNYQVYYLTLKWLVKNGLKLLQQLLCTINLLIR